MEGGWYETFTCIFGGLILAGVNRSKDESGNFPLSQWMKGWWHPEVVPHLVRFLCQTGAKRVAYCTVSTHRARLVAAAPLMSPYNRKSVSFTQENVNNYWNYKENAFLTDQWTVMDSYVMLLSSSSYHLRYMGAGLTDSFKRQSLPPRVYAHINTQLWDESS